MKMKTVKLTLFACQTGGVVTLDPCGHLCSLDGAQVTVPTPLTQGNAHNSYPCLIIVRKWCLNKNARSNIHSVLSLFNFPLSP